MGLYRCGHMNMMHQICQLVLPKWILNWNRLTLIQEKSRMILNQTLEDGKYIYILLLIM